jgi:hypothetical protein
MALRRACPVQRSDAAHLDARTRSVSPRPCPGAPPFCPTQELSRTPAVVYQPSSGALYPALRRLERRGLLSAEQAHSAGKRRQRRYQLTPAGQGAAVTPIHEAPAACHSTVLQSNVPSRERHQEYRTEPAPRSRNARPPQHPEEHFGRGPVEISLIRAVHMHALCTRTQRHLAGPPQLVHRRGTAAHRPHLVARTLHTHAYAGLIRLRETPTFDATPNAKPLVTALCIRKSARRTRRTSGAATTSSRPSREGSPSATPTSGSSTSTSSRRSSPPT